MPPLRHPNPGLAGAPSKCKMDDEPEGHTDPASDVRAEAEGVLKLSRQRVVGPLVLISARFSFSFEREK